MESTNYTEMEMGLREMVVQEGELRHSHLPIAAESKDDDEEADERGAVREIGTEAGLGSGRRSREKTMLLDLGNGPEDVILIDWAEGDPEVCHPKKQK
jgi:hypothetical protein